MSKIKTDDGTAVLYNGSQRGNTMKLPHRQQLLHLTVCAAALPVAARVARAQLCIISLLGVVWSFEAKAQIQDCTKALVKATLVSNTLDVTNLSLAWSLSEGAYNEAKTNAGASAVIYGVPVGADYGQFHQNIQTKTESLGIQRFQLRANAYATSGIELSLNLGNNAAKPSIPEKRQAGHQHRNQRRLHHPQRPSSQP